jgi:large subunit ribosomal protein L7/L12
VKVIINDMEDMKMSEKIAKFVEEIKSLTILELKDLVKAIEEEFGVSAAPVAVAAGPATAAAAAPAEEQTEFTVILRTLVLRRLRLSRLFVRSQTLASRKQRTLRRRSSTSRKASPRTKQTLLLQSSRKLALL